MHRQLVRILVQRQPHLSRRYGAGNITGITLDLFTRNTLGGYQEVLLVILVIRIRRLRAVIRRLLIRGISLGRIVFRFRCAASVGLRHSTPRLNSALQGSVIGYAFRNLSRIVRSSVIVDGALARKIARIAARITKRTARVCRIRSN